MIELMAALPSAGYRMALVTNNVREWEPRWHAMAPIDDIFGFVIDSAYVRVRKLDPEIHDLTVRLRVPTFEWPVRGRPRGQLRRRSHRGDAGDRLRRRRAGGDGDPQGA
jgi:hypothetical protein